MYDPVVRRVIAVAIAFAAALAAHAEDCPPDRPVSPVGPIGEALRAAPCAKGPLAVAAESPAPALDAALAAKLSGTWSDSERGSLARVLGLLPAALVSKMRIHSIERTHVASVDGHPIPNFAVYTPTSGGRLQVADATFDRAADQSMVVLLHEALHSTQMTALGRPVASTDTFMREQTGWSYEIVSTGLFSRAYRWKHDDSKPIYVGPNYGDGLTPPDNAYEEMVAMMVDYVAAPDALLRDRPAAYAWIKSNLFGGREYSCGSY